ncbi:MAG: hypothetical protein IKC26_04315 [Clostridia bacterium]|nr:hypothetical protein [Clostridia bacterium]
MGKKQKTLHRAKAARCRDGCVRVTTLLRVCLADGRLTGHRVSLDMTVEPVAAYLPSGGGARLPRCNSPLSA